MLTLTEFFLKKPPSQKKPTHFNHQTVTKIKLATQTNVKYLNHLMNVGLDDF